MRTLTKTLTAAAAVTFALACLAAPAHAGSDRTITIDAAGASQIARLEVPAVVPGTSGDLSVSVELAKDAPADGTLFVTLLPVRLTGDANRPGYDEIVLTAPGLNTPVSQLTGANTELMKVDVKRGDVVDVPLEWEFAFDPVHVQGGNAAVDGAHRVEVDVLVRIEGKAETQKDDQGPGDEQRAGDPDIRDTDRTGTSLGGLWIALGLIVPSLLVLWFSRRRSEGGTEVWAVRR